MHPKVKKKLTLLMLSALFMIPTLSAFYAYYKVDGTFFSKSNKGHLLQPVLSASDIGLKEIPNAKKKWQVVLITSNDTHEDVKNLKLLRHHLLLLGKEMSRTKIMMVVDKTQLNDLKKAISSKDFPDLSYQLMNETIKNQQEEKAVFAYVVDPLNNVVLWYPKNNVFDAIYSDIKHLLKISHIG